MTRLECGVRGRGEMRRLLGGGSRGELEDALCMWLEEVGRWEGNVFEVAGRLGRRTGIYVYVCKAT